MALVGLGADAVKKILLSITMAAKFLEDEGFTLRGTSACATLLCCASEWVRHGCVCLWVVWDPVRR